MFVHDTAAVLIWLVQNTVAISWPGPGSQWKKISNDFELRWKKQPQYVWDA